MSETWKCRTCRKKFPPEALTLKSYTARVGECATCAPAAFERIRAANARHVAARGQR
jgi:hypothetical protein